MSFVMVSTTDAKVIATESAYLVVVLGPGLSRSFLIYFPHAA